MLLDEAADFFHSIGFMIAAPGSRAAAQAGSISGLFGSLRLSEESNIFAPRPPRRARGPAIHSRRGDREHEFSVSAGIARQHRTPARVVPRLCPDHFRIGWMTWHLAFCCEYGIGRHSKESVRQKPRNGLSESCGQSRKESGAVIPNTGAVQAGGGISRAVSLGDSTAHEILSTLLGAGPSLRLKDGCAQEDA